jgi:formylglycine-generating enzyme required for sulfatase activity/predicted Ser/Thr protein kinase
MEKLGRYELRGELGRGGMGVVYRAYDPTLDREVAIKSVRLEGVTEQERASLEERLSREARAAAKLQHPHIVAVYDFFRVEDRAYIVMEYVKGSMLDAMIAAGNRNDTKAILRVLEQAASALDAAHAQGIVHRDVKPGNILIAEGGDIKITDFGIARITTAGATETLSQGPGSTVGTLGYMSPEQIRGEKVDGRADQFSLGIVAYQLFSGEMPFVADTWIALSYKLIHEPAPKLAGKIPGVTPAMDEVLQRAVAKKPEDRFPDCRSFVKALGGTKGMTASQRNRWLIGLAAGMALAAGIFSLWEKPKQNILPKPEDPVVAPIEYTAPAPKQEEAAPPAAATPTKTPDVFPFVAIPAGRFFMGSDTDTEDQKPRHAVNLTQAFEMAVTETTERQWNLVMTGKDAGTELPKVNVSWNEAQAFAAKLNQRGDGYLYRLPTEAEWEYAARAKGSERPKHLDDLAWFSDNSNSQRQPAGTRVANAFGLQDMLGNVMEWTADWFGEEYYANSPAANPKGPAQGTLKIYRGGAFDTQGMMLSAAWRFAAEPTFKSENLGFRVVRTKR